MRFLQRAQPALSLTLLTVCGVLAGLFAYRSLHQPRQGDLAALNHALAESGGAAGKSSNPAAAAHSGVTGGQAATPGTIPLSVPDIRMPDPQGRTVALSQFRGHPLIINFWATWCPPCRREMPLLQQLWTRYSGNGLRIVGIAVDSQDAVTQYLRHTHVGYPLLVGEQQGSEAAASFGIEPVLPFSVFADASGRIVAVKVGELHLQEATYIVDTLRQVSDGKESLPQARLAIAAQMHRFALQRAKNDTESATKP